MFEVKLDGLDALKKRMAQVQEATRNRLAKNALSAGARLIAKRAKSIVQSSDDPETGRQIARNITTRYRSKQSKQTGDVIVSVGVSYPRGRMPKGNPDDGRETPHWHLLELGTEHMKAKPFLVPAAVSVGPDVPQAFITKFSEDLKKEIGKL